MSKVHISPEIRNALPEVCLGLLRAKVEVRQDVPELNALINSELELLSASMDMSDIHGLRGVGVTRQAYKALGKEPSRYRPSAEALLRRVLSGKGLYRVNNVVDALNLVSVSSGFSIGGWDAGRIQGDATFGIGREGEPFEAIGRGDLNVAFFPVFRDELGAFATPTSDSTRTMIRPDTRDFLLCLYGFEGDTGLEKGLARSRELLEKYASATDITTEIIC